MTETQARLSPVKKKEPMPANASTVKAFLMRNSKATAVEIMHAIGMSHADLYRALVWLEARGLAFVHMRFSEHCCIGGYWEAA